MNTVSISPGRLFKDSLNAVGSIYGPLLLINSPSLVFILLNSFLQSRPILLGIFFLIYFVVLVPLLTGATIIYTYRHLNQNHIGIAEAFQVAASKYWQLLFGLILLILILIPAYILLIILSIYFTIRLTFPFLMLIPDYILIPAYILLIILGIYLTIRLTFPLYAIAVEDCSAIEGIKRSWELTKGRLWSIFLALLAVSLALFVPIVIISILVTTSLGEEIDSVTYQIISGILSYLIGPIASIYYILLYAGLQLRDRRQQAERG